VSSVVENRWGRGGREVEKKGADSLFSLDISQEINHLKKEN